MSVKSYDYDIENYRLFSTLHDDREDLMTITLRTTDYPLLYTMTGKKESL